MALGWSGARHRTKNNISPPATVDRTKGGAVIILARMTARDRAEVEMLAVPPLVQGTSRRKLGG